MRVIWSEPARSDLRRINAWLTGIEQPQFAIRMISAIRYGAKFLVDFPRGGRPHRAGDRVLVVIGTSYLIRYRVAGNVVEVIRVHHERENWHVEER